MEELTEVVCDAAKKLKKNWQSCSPSLAIICGSGWGSIADVFVQKNFMGYSEIPGMSKTTVAGHAGKLFLCGFQNSEFLIFQGRKHFYEGEGWAPVVFPVLLAKKLGVKSILLTNAAGGISNHLEVSDLMVIEDHMNFMPGNPLIGPILHQESPRFPDQSKIYDSHLRKIIVQAAKDCGTTLRHGIYLALSGPAFETPAEISAFAKLGADAVGMSTVPEAMVANSLGMKVLGLSCISNLAAGINMDSLSHEDVVRASQKALPKMRSIILRFLHLFF